MNPATDARIVILLPCFNDWNALDSLLPEIERVLQRHSITATVVLADDGSTSPPDKARLARHSHSAIAEIVLVELVRNLGNQSAIAVALSLIQEHIPCKSVVIMDSDHEDLPEYIGPLVQEGDRLKGIVFARRSRRNEGIVFRICYRIYQLIFRILAGRWIFFGNYSVVPSSLLSKVTSLPGLWSHYAATIAHSPLPYTSIRADRGSRRIGKTSMGFSSLVVHGFMSFVVHGRIVAARVFLTCVTLFALSLGSLALASFGAWDDAATEVSRTWLFALTMAMITAMSAFSLFIFLSIQSRIAVPPIREYAHHVRVITKLRNSHNDA